MAPADQPDGGNPRSGGGTDRLVSPPLVGGNFLQNLEIGLPGRGRATGHPGAVGAGLGASTCTIAWRILHLVTWGRDCPNLPCDVVFDPEEWQAAWIVAHRRPPPDTPPPLGQISPGLLIAGFGGFLGRKHNRVTPVPKRSGKACRRSECLPSPSRPAKWLTPRMDKIVGNRVALTGETLHVRRVVIRLNKPTRNGNKNLIILTNLPKEKVDAFKGCRTLSRPVGN